MPTTKQQLEEQNAANAAEDQEAAADDDGDYYPVPLAGHDGVTKDVRTLPATRWPASAFRALNRSDFDTFFDIILHEDDYDTFVDLDPDPKAIIHFAEKASEVGGDNLGNSNGRRGSSRPTRRR
jgi:hypothetical protein